MHFGAWVVILLCAANFLSTSAHEDSKILITKHFFISSNKLELTDPQKFHDFGKIKEEASENINYGEKAGKGAYGGANVVHKRPGDKSGALFYKPSFFISCVILAHVFVY